MTPNVAAVFETYPASHRVGLVQLRQLILDTAARQDHPVEVSETLRWGQPSYIASKGSTLRLGLPKAGGFALFAHCQTTIISRFAEMFGDSFSFEGNRAVVFQKPADIQPEKLCFLIHHGLTYHQKG